MQPDPIARKCAVARESGSAAPLQALGSSGARDCEGRYEPVTRAGCAHLVPSAPSMAEERETGTKIRRLKQDLRASLDRFSANVHKNTTTCSSDFITTRNVW